MKTSKSPKENRSSHQQLIMARRSFLQTMTAIGLLPLAGASASAAELSSHSTDTPSWPEQDDPKYWSRIRKQFSIPSDESYFNTGTVGACPRRVIDAVVDSMRTMERTIAHYDYRAEHVEYIAGYRPQEELRNKAGGIINATGAEVALTQNATMGINFVANGLDLKSGDEVLVTDQEHPGAIGPWQLRAKREGIAVKLITIPVPTPDPQTVVKLFADGIGPRTRVLAVPHITSRHGIVLPVRELCDLAKEKGLFTLIDGAQAIGQLRVDVKKIGCDAYSCSPHKWLFAPPGNGLLYISADRQKDVWATLASEEWDDYSPKSGAWRFMQFGTANAALLAGLDAAFDFYLRIGPDKIEQRILRMADQLRAGLQSIRGVTITSPLNPAMAGAMVTYGIPGLHGLKLQDELWNRKKFRVRWQGDILVRQSVHIHNDPREIEETLEVIKSLARA